MDPIFEYFEIIVNRLQNPLSKNEYGERHHIYPKSCGGTNDKLNIVKLTPEEHYRCHCLLPYLFEDDFDSHRKMVFAWHRMRTSQSKDFAVSAKEYGDLQRAYAKEKSDSLKGKATNKGYKFTPEQRQRLSESHKGRVAWNKGKHFDEAYKKKMSEKLKGRKKSEEWKRKISESTKGRIISEAQRKKISETLKKYNAKRKAAQHLQS